MSPAELRAGSRIGVRRLRIGVLIPGMDLRLWEWTLLQRIRDSDYAEICVVVTLGADGTPMGIRESSAGGVTTPVRAMVERLYERLEHRVTLEPDACAKRDASDLLAAVPLFSGSAPSRGSAPRVAAADLDAIKAYDLDVFMRLGSVPADVDLAGAARHGLWSLQDGDERKAYGDPPGFWEVFANEPTIAQGLRISTVEGSHVIDRSLTPNDATSVRRINNKALWKAVALILRRLRTLYRDGPQSLQAAATIAGFARDEPVPPGPPGALQLMQQIAKVSGRALCNRAHDLLYLPQWVLLFHLGDAPCMEIDRFREIIPAKDRYWADPITLHRDGKYYIFIEEMPFSTNKGYISVIIMNEHGEFEPPVKVLERPYRLSYPFVFEHEGETYMAPESMDNGTVELYRCVQFPLHWEPAGSLLRNVIAVDPTLLRHDGRWWLFANMVDYPGGSTWDELFLFHSEALLDGTWTPHPLNPVVSDVTKARPAGPIYRHAGRLYRPAQDSSIRYRIGIRLQEIARLTVDEYVEREAATIMPTWNTDIIGTHTLAHAGRLTVIDALRPRLKYDMRPGRYA